MKSLMIATALGALVMSFGAQDPDSKVPGPEVGKSAPTARLNNHEGVVVQVGGKSEHWTILAFFPKAATPG